jgi:glycosyltransferase involved in cell wall biosynthesis
MKKKRATVSVAIIAKDEAATITPSIESIRDNVDEIVVLVDDKTTDNTAELAKKAGAHIVGSFTWEDDFAGARNKAIAKCTKDWICIMDAHEVLHPNSKMIFEDLMRRVLKNGDLQDTELFSAYIYMNPRGKDLENLIPETFLMQPRLFKNNGEHFYTGRVHNYIETKKGNKGLKRPVPELVFIHRRTESNEQTRKSQRIEMNVPLLLKDIEDHPEQPRPLFYLANTYYEMEKWDDALEYYEKYLMISGWAQERAQALLMAASILAEKRDHKKAREYALRAIQEDWERPEFYMILGDFAMNHKNYYEAEHWYKSACDMKPPIKSGMFLRGPAYTYLPYAKLAMVYSTPGVEDFFKALQSAEKALSLGYPEKDLVQKMDIWKESLTLKPDRKNVLIYDENNTFTFIKDTSNRLMDYYNVATAAQYEYTAAQWADVIFFEWCAKNILKASGMPKKPGQKWIVRLHGFEVYSSKRITQIQWDKVDVLIFVCDHVKQHFEELYFIPDSVKKIVIPNGVDLNLWSYADRSIVDKKTISVIGILTEKKGPQLLGQVIKYFDKYRPEYKFQLRFDIVDKPCMAERTLRHIIKDCKNWEWVPRQDSLNRFLEDTKFLLSTSELESFSYVIAEAMSKGIKPLIYDWLGSRDIWPEKLIWTDINELLNLIDEEDEYNSSEYRDYIKNNFSIDTLVNSIKNEIESLLSSGVTV